MSVVITLDNLLIPRLTTVARDAIAAVNGMRIYNTTDDQFEWFENGAWTANPSGISDHGGLTGLGDDDHTQYLLRQPAADVVINDAASDFDFRFEGVGEPNLLFLDAGTDTIGIGGVAISGVQLAIEDDTDEVSAEIIRLLSTRATRATNDEVFMTFYNTDNMGVQVETNRITSIIRDISSTIVDSTLVIDSLRAGATVEMMRLGFNASGDGGVTINEGANANIDFRVEGGAEIFLISTDAGDDVVAIGGVPVANVQLLVERDTDEVASELLRLLSTRATRTINDEIFMTFRHPDSSGTPNETNRITSVLRSTTAGAVDSMLTIDSVRDGVSVEMVRMGFTGAGAGTVVINEDGNANVDFLSKGSFRVESSTELFLIQALKGDDVVGIGGAPVVGVQLTVEDDTDEVSAELLRLSSTRATPANGDEIFQSFYQRDSFFVATEFGRITSIVQNITDGSERGTFRFAVQQHGSLIEMLRMQATGASTEEVVVNEAASDCDFRIEGATETSLFVTDAGLDVAGIGGPVTSGVQLTIEKDTDEVSSELLRLRSVRATRADNDEVFMGFYNPDDAATQRETSRITSILTDASTATPFGSLEFEVSQSGTLRRFLALTAPAAAGQMVFSVNPDNVNINFLFTTTCGGTITMNNDGDSLDATGDVQLNWAGPAAFTGLTTMVDAQSTLGVLLLTNTQDQTSLELLRLISDRATRADNDEVVITAFADDDAGATNEVGRLNYIATDVSAATFRGQIMLEVADGAATSAMQEVFRVGEINTGALQFGFFGSNATRGTFTLNEATDDFTLDDAETTLNNQQVLRALISTLKAHGILL